MGEGTIGPAPEKLTKVRSRLGKVAAPEPSRIMAGQASSSAGPSRSPSQQAEEHAALLVKREEAGGIISIPHLLSSPVFEEVLHYRYQTLGESRSSDQHKRL